MKPLIAALAVMAALCPIQARAMALDYPPAQAYELMTDTATVMNVAASTYNFTSITNVAGSHIIVVQSTGTVNFCCSFEALASSNTTAGIPGCIRGNKDPGGEFYERTFKRWAQNLTLRCTSFGGNVAGILRVLQGR